MRWIDWSDEVSVARISLFVSLLALLVSAVVGYYQVTIERRRHREERDESRQAFMHVYFTEPSRHDYYLHIENQGKAEARNVRILLDGVPIQGHPSMVWTLSGDLAYGAGHTEMFPFVFLMGPKERQCPHRIEVVWDDDYAKDRTRHLEGLI